MPVGPDYMVYGDGEFNPDFYDGKSTMQKITIIFHGGCPDGTAAALAARCHLDMCVNVDVTYYPGSYTEPPPDVTDSHVYIVDFSYPAAVLREMAKTAKSITILDHHKTAEEDLKEFIATPKTMKMTAYDFAIVCEEVGSHCIRAEFDMTRSGAVMAWNHFHPNDPVPLFFQYIQDRDLWTKKLPDIEQFSWGLQAYKLDLDTWFDLTQGYLFSEPHVQQNLIDDLVGQGESVERFFRLKVESAMKNAHSITIKRNLGSDAVPRYGTDVTVFDGLAVNAPGWMASDLGGMLAQKCEQHAQGWGAVYTYSDNMLKVSLRSRGDTDVGKIAKGFSCNGRGGGHKAAAGFEIEDLSRVEFMQDDDNNIVMVIHERRET